MTSSTVTLPCTELTCKLALSDSRNLNPYNAFLQGVTMTPTQTSADRKPLFILETTLLRAEEQRSRGHHEQARILLEKAYTRVLLMYGPTHPLLIQISEKIVEAYHILGKYYKSSEAGSVCIDTLSKHLGKDHPRTLEAVQRLTGNRELLRFTS